MVSFIEFAFGDGLILLAWDGENPIYDGMEDSYRNKVEESWQKAKASGDFRVIDSPPAEAKKPLWVDFNLAMLSKESWIDWDNSLRESPISKRLSEAMLTASVNGNLGALQATFDLAVQLSPPPLESRQEWQTLSDTFHIGMRFL